MRIFFFCFIISFFSFCSPKEMSKDGLESFFKENFIQLWKLELIGSINNQIKAASTNSDSLYLLNLKNQKVILENTFLEIKANGIELKNLRNEVCKKFISDIKIEDTINASCLYIIETMKGGEQVQHNFNFVILTDKHLEYKNYKLTHEGFVLSSEGWCNKTKSEELNNYFNKVNSSIFCKEDDYTSTNFFTITMVKNKTIKSKIIFYLCRTSILKIE